MHFLYARHSSLAGCRSLVEGLFFARRSSLVERFSRLGVFPLCAALPSAFVGGEREKRPRVAGLDETARNGQSAARTVDARLACARAWRFWSVFAVAIEVIGDGGPVHLRGPFPVNVQAQRG